MSKNSILAFRGGKVVLDQGVRLMNKPPSLIAKMVGRTVATIGFALIASIPLWFLLQLLGIFQGGFEQFGWFGYAFIIASIFFPGFGLIFLGMRISGNK